MDSSGFNNFSSQLIRWMESWGLNRTTDTFPFAELSLELFRLQYDSIEIYRRLCDSRGCDPSSVTDWRDIPRVPTAAFKDLEWTSLPPQNRPIYFQSSGTTGSRRSRHFHSPESLVIYEKSVEAGFRRLFPTRTVGASHRDYDFIFLIPQASAIPHSSLGHMAEVLKNSFDPDNRSVHLSDVSESGQWVLNKSQVLKFLNSPSDGQRPVIIVGTAFSFVHLSDLMKESGVSFALPEGSLVMETGGYKGQSRELTRSDLYQLISSALHVPLDAIVTEYGMSELSSQAYRQPGPPPNHFVCPPWMKIRIIDPESGRESSTGAMGIVAIHDLANVYSIAALETEDLGSAWVEGFELVGRLTSSEPKGCSLFESGLSSPFNR